MFHNWYTCCVQRWSKHHVLIHVLLSDTSHCGSWRDVHYDRSSCCVTNWCRRNVLLEKCTCSVASPQGADVASKLPSLKGQPFQRRILRTRRQKRSPIIMNHQDTREKKCVGCVCCVKCVFVLCVECDVVCVSVLLGVCVQAGLLYNQRVA